MKVTDTAIATVAIALCGCGRVAFDPVGTLDAPGPDPDAIEVSFTRPLSPLATFLQPDIFNPAELAAVELPLVLSLGDEGIPTGRTLHLAQLGGYDYTGSSPNEGHVLGLFSSSEVVLAPDQRARVPGAIAAGVDTVTIADIPGDFDVAYLRFRPDPSPRNMNGVDVEVPAGARYLMITFVDDAYADNVPDPDLGVSVALLR